MPLPFIIIAALTIAAAVAAMNLRNLVHCALAVAVALGGLAAAYLQLDAQFVGFAQILVYIGAVAILIVFAILLTRGSEQPQQAIFSTSWIGGAAVAVIVFGLLTATIVLSSVAQQHSTAAPEVAVREI